MIEDEDTGTDDSPDYSEYPTFICYSGGSELQGTMPPTVKAKPREYKDGDDFSAYLNHFNRIATAMEWTDAVKLVQLETVLRGKAQREFEVFIEENDAITWTQMVGKLKEELVPSMQKSLDDFQQMRLGDRSLKEFYAALIRQSKIAHGEMGENARHAIVRAQLLQSIPKQLRVDASKQQELSGLGKDALLTLLTRVYDADPRDVQGEQTYEPMVGQVGVERQKSIGERLSELETKQCASGKEMSELKGMFTELCAELKKNRPKNYQDTKVGRNKSQVNLEQVKCYRCQEMGHFASSCTNQETCGYCKKQGHRYSTCPTKPKNE
jgi:hypothetical protein